MEQQRESQEGAIAVSMLMILYSQKLGSSQEELMETRTENLTRRKLDKIFTAADGIVRGASQSLDSEEDIRQSITLQIILDLK